MIFKQIYQLILIWAETTENKQDLAINKNEKTVKEILKISKIPLQNNLIIVGINRTFSTALKNIQTIILEKHREGDETKTKNKIAYQNTL